MKILLIGKYGQLASSIIASLSQFDVFELVSYSSSQLNILDYENVKSEIIKQKPNIIINTAAYHVVPACETHLQEAFAVNAFALKNLTAAANEVGSKLITYSTDYVFDGRKKSPYIETDLPNPLQIYGLSKYLGEQICTKYYDKSIIIRTNGLYGGKDGSKQKKGNFVLQMINELNNKDEVFVSSEQIVSPTYAIDLAYATLQLIEKKAEPGIYHIVNEGYCSWFEFTLAIAKEKDIKTKITSIDRGGQSGGVKRPLFSALQNAKAAKLGIQLRNWKHALRSYIKTI